MKLLNWGEFMGNSWDCDRTLIEKMERLRWHLNIHHLFLGNTWTLPFIPSHGNVGNLHLCHRSDSSHAHLPRTDHHTTRISFPARSILTQPFPFFLPSFLKSERHCLLVPNPLWSEGQTGRRGFGAEQRGVWAYINWNKRVFHAQHTRDALNRWSRMENRIDWSPFPKRLLNL